MRVDRDELLDRIDLPALADELLGVQGAAMRTSMWPCPVPTHAQSGRTPPVSIFVSHTGEQRWHCHGCGEGGTAIDLVMHTETLDVGEAIAWLADRTGAGDGPMLEPRRIDRRCQPLREDPIPELDGYVTACETVLWGRSTDALRWLTDTRGLSEAVIRVNRLGFDPGPIELPRPAGIPRAHGIVLPVLDYNDQAIFTQTRRTGRQIAGPRYLNCAGRAAPNPRLALYQCPRQVTDRIGSRLVVCEGAIDALTIADASIPAAALLGSTVTDHSVASRIADQASEVIIAFDNDEAGERGAKDLAECLAEHGVQAYRLRPPRAVVDVNDWRMQTGSDWTTQLRRTVGGLAKRTPTPSLILG